MNKLRTRVAHRARSVAVATVVVAVVMAASGCGASGDSGGSGEAAESAEVGTMTVEQARSYYPGGCSVWDPRQVYLETTRGPDGETVFSGPEGEAVPDAVRTAAVAYADASAGVTGLIADPPAAWPEVVADDMVAFIEFQRALDAYLAGVAAPGSQWPAPLSDEVRASGRAASEAVRAGLGLPPFGEGCVGYSPADYVDTISGGAVTTVELVFAYETVPDGNTTVTINDGGDLQFGNINFSGSGTWDDDPVEIGLQAHVLFLDGTGPSGGYMDVTTADGDVLVLELTSRATRVDDGATVDGTFRVVGGTGQFAGVSGGGLGSGVRNAALGAAVRWTVELQLEGL